MPMSSARLVVKCFLFPREIPTPSFSSFDTLPVTPRYLVLVLVHDTSDTWSPRCYCVLMSSGRVNETKFDAGMDEDGSAVSCQTIFMLLLLYTKHI